MQQPPWQPALTPGASAWRYALAAALSLSAWGAVIQGQWTEHRVLLVVDVTLGVAAFVLVRYRRDRPLAVALATVLLSAASSIAAGPATLAMVSMATRRVVWQVVLVGVLGLLAAQTWTVTQPQRTDDPYWVPLTVNVVAGAAVLAWGMYVGSRRELLWTLRERAERAEAEQELRVGKARGDERARIAREMHDTLAHRISQVSMHAGALAFRDDLSADDMRESAGVIQQQANEALTELRAVLGVLRDAGTGQPVAAPQPTYDDVAGLVTEARRSGMHVEYDAAVHGEVPVPATVGRTVYRIVQEGLTNARKHAPGATVFVRLEGAPEVGIDVVLRNRLGFGPATTPGSGLGLVGLGERATLRGGRLESRRERGMFVLQAWIPWAP